MKDIKVRILREREREREERKKGTERGQRTRKGEKER